MSIVRFGRDKSVNRVVSIPQDIEQIAGDLCEQALNDAKAQLHPLIQSVELDRLDQRQDFVQAFRSAMEQRIARRLVLWQPGVQAVFRFDETRPESMAAWDGSIHLLVKIPRLSIALKMLGRRLDRNLLKYLKQLSWSRFRKRQSILEVQQVTPNELRHGIGYGAMFCAVYTVPIKVWPQDKKRAR